MTSGESGSRDAHAEHGSDSGRGSDSDHGPSSDSDHGASSDESIAGKGFADHERFSASVGANNSEGERLQKVMAAAGVASRRVSEDLIAAGRVSVNGQVVTEPGRRVLPTDLVSVDGSAIQLDPTRRYLMLNKPVGVVSSLADENGRPDLSVYTREFEERLFNVGRLDAQTSGLIVLTNDGELAHVLAHPSFGVSKTYVAKVEGEVAPATLRRLTGGVELDDGPIAADRARLLGKPSRSQSMVEIELHSGRNRIVRRMLAAVGHPVVELVRRQFGPLTLGSLGSGQIRDLTKVELGQLLTLSRTANAQPSDERSNEPSNRRAKPTPKGRQ
jgi:pseudouridine synthase